MNKYRQYPDAGLKQPVRSLEESSKAFWDHMRAILKKEFNV